jgi:hypothetical protein
MTAEAVRPSTDRVPLRFKLAYTAFMAVLMLSRFAPEAL